LQLLYSKGYQTFKIESLHQFVYINYLRLILDGHPLIAIHKGRYYRRGDGIALGPGPFVAALESCTDAKAEVVGKPEPEFFHQVLNDMGSDAQSTIMVGDVSTVYKGGGGGVLCIDLIWMCMVYCTYILIQILENR
jgi:ribonucleotide monophosphatase NagD (HAD superfamily)